MSEQSAAVPGRHPRPCRRRLSHRRWPAPGRRVPARSAAASCAGWPPGSARTSRPARPRPGVRSAAAAGSSLRRLVVGREELHHQGGELAPLRSCLGCYARFPGYPGELGAGRCRGAGGDRGPAFGPGHFGQGQGFQLGGQRAEPAGVGEPGRVGLVLGRGEQPGDGLAVDGAGPLDVGAVQGRRVGRAGAAGLAAPGTADGDAAGQAEADLAEGRLDRCPGLVCAAASGAGIASPWPGSRKSAAAGLPRAGVSPARGALKVYVVREIPV